MKFSKTLTALVLAAATLTAQAQSTLNESFNDVSQLAAAGWVFTPTSTTAGSGWFQGNAGVFTASTGASNAYLAANWVDGVTAISDWVFTPVLSLTSSSTLSFDLRLLGGGYLDTVEVWASTAGSSTDTASFIKLATFTSSTDTGWVTQTLSLAGFDGSGRIAFRYVVADTSVDGNYAGIDTVAVVPEPASSALMLVGMAAVGALAVRRRHA